MNDEQNGFLQLHNELHFFHRSSFSVHRSAFSVFFMIYTSSSETETISLGFAFGKQLPANSVVCFFGELAAGKTTFIKGMAAGASEYPEDQVNSPTFVYLNVYEGAKTVFHFDLYRLHDADEFFSMGFDEVFTQGGICCIEWSERISALLPHDCIQVRMSHAGENKRRIEIDGIPGREPYFWKEM